MIKLTVNRITETTSEEARNPHVVKLVCEQVIKHALGTSKRTKTYYISTDASDLAEGQVLDVDLAVFEIRQREFEYADENGEKHTMLNDWLVPRMQGV